MHRVSNRLLLGLAALCVGSSAASAQTFLSGALSDGTSGPLGPGVYVTNGAISVPAGQTLTIAAGAILKFKNGHYFDVNGTLLVNGAPGNKVIFTDFRDDSAGGDSNGDGASSGAPGWWYGLQLDANASASSLNHFEVRYAGYGNYGGLRLSACSATIANGLVRDGNAAGIDLQGNSYPQISDCVLQQNGGRAIDNVRVDAAAGLSNNTASGNGFDQLRVSSGTLASSVTIGANNLINGVMFVDTALTVPAGLTLTLTQGVVVKFGISDHLTCNGTLMVDGASGSKVVFTDYRDDSAGGDTNGDGGSSGAPGWWYGLIMNDTADASLLRHFEVRYSGYGNYGGVRLNSCNATLQNGLVRNSNQDGLELQGNSFPTVTACSFQNNGARAIDAVSIDAVPGFTGNTASGNAMNQMRVTVGTLAAPRTIAKNNCIGGTLFLDGVLNIPSSLSLTFKQGVVVKFNNGDYANVDGALITQGVSGDPVIFTDYRDDSVGGDTNGNGASSGVAGWWYGLIFNATSDASNLDFFEVRYAGYGNYGGIEITNSDLSITRGAIRNCHAAGIDMNSSASLPTINRCLIENNGGSAITGASIEAVPRITRNLASGNGADQLLVTSASVDADLYIDGAAGVNDMIVVQGVLNIGGGARLTLGPGAAFKFGIGQYVNVVGGLDVLGTPNDPVVFTDLRDDEIAGDSNGGGASSGAPGWWYGLIVNSGSAACDIQHLRIRFAGYGNYGGIKGDSTLASYKHVRAEHCNAYGFAFSAAAKASYLAAHNCGSGVSVTGGAFDLSHVTVSGGAFGIRRSGGFSGSVVDSIAWGCTTNFDGFVPANVRYSCGYSGGGVGNINVSPTFFDAVNGDLRLLPGSPCIAAGDPASTLDADCSRADMGAYPSLSLSAPETYCSGKPNSAGCTPFLAYYGHASLSSPESFALRAFNVVNNKNGLFFYGFSGRSSSPFQGGLKCVADPVKRLPVLLSGGSVGFTDCSGVFSFDFNALIQSGNDPLLVQGAMVNTQVWYRDPGVPSNTGLSDGVEFVVCQ